MVPTIKTKNFILRPINENDIGALAKAINDKLITKNILAPYPYTKKDAKKFVATRLQDQKKKKPKIFGFVIDIHGEMVGHVSIQPEGHKAVIGYWLARRYWGNGIMTQAVKLVTVYGFNQLRLRKIYANVFPRNKASMRVLEKAGYKKEGFLKKHFKKGNNFLDVFLFAKVY